MTWMQFIVEILKIVVWPLVVIIFLFNLRNPISRLIPLAKKLKYKDVEVEFWQELEAATKDAQAAFPELKRDRRSNLIASASKLPNSAVLESWKVLDETAEKLIRSKNAEVNLESSTRYKQIEDLLVKGNIIDIQKGKLFRELRQLRNKVAHAVGYEVGKAEAIQYVELCFMLAEHFDSLISGSTGPS